MAQVTTITRDISPALPVDLVAQARGILAHYRQPWANALLRYVDDLECERNLLRQELTLRDDGWRGRAAVGECE